LGEKETRKAVKAPLRGGMKKKGLRKRGGKKKHMGKEEGRTR